MVGARPGDDGPRPRRGALARLAARVLAPLGVLMWLIAFISFGTFQAVRPGLWARFAAGASIGGPVLLGSGALAIASLLLQRRR